MDEQEYKEKKVKDSLSRWRTRWEHRQIPVKLDGVRYESYVAMARAMGVNQNSIRYHIKRYGHYKGKKLEYVETENE